MSSITVFSATFCNLDAFIQGLLGATGYREVPDAAVIAEASRISGLGESKIRKAFSARTSVFNPFTHEKERSVAYLRLAVARLLGTDGTLLHGFSSLLVPSPVSHVLSICLVADMKFRTERAVAEQGMGHKEAVRLIHRQDEECILWVDTLFGGRDPWDAGLYDMVIPVDKTGLEDAIALVRENLLKEVLHPTHRSLEALADFRLAAQVEAALADEGHAVDVSAENGSVTITINKHVLLLSRLEEELRAIAALVEGVKAVETKVGENFYQADIYRKYDFQVPAKVLLVDDEREFVQTLSERLSMRDVGSAVAYDGESALTLVQEDEPEVMILDLKMPGIDGIEVLRRVKQTRPEIEVIILTGHGSEADRRVCMELGAFAYLQKPVNIDLLSETLKKANDKIQARKSPPAQHAG